MKDIHCDTLMTALDFWSRIRAQRDDVQLGYAVLNRLFEIQPRAKSVFGYDINEQAGQAQTSTHAKMIVHLFDSILDMLGPDKEFVEEILSQVASKHKARNVPPTFFPFMGQAFVDTFRCILKESTKNGEAFECDSENEHELQAWEDIYETISNEILRNMLLA